MISLEQHLHRTNANRGLGATKIADRMMKAKAGRWSSPANEAKARELYAILAGRTMASHYAATTQEA